MYNDGIMHVRLDPQMEAQLKALAAQTGKSEDFYVLQAVKNYLEDVQDIAVAKQAISQDSRTWTQEEIERELGFDFSQKN